MAAVFWTSNEANEIASDNQRAQIERAITDELHDSVRRLSNLAAFGNVALRPTVNEASETPEPIVTALHRLRLDVIGLAALAGTHSQ